MSPSHKNQAEEPASRYKHFFTRKCLFRAYSASVWRDAPEFRPKFWRIRLRKTLHLRETRSNPDRSRINAHQWPAQVKLLGFRP